MVQTPDFVVFQVDTPGVGEITPNRDVGTVYEIGINGVGLMLADDPQRPETLPVAVVPDLASPRLATGDTPMSQAIERYVLETVHDWSAGAGQRWLNRQGSTSRAFFDSEGVDPFTVPGEIRNLPSMGLDGLAVSNLRGVVVDGVLYIFYDGNKMKVWPSGSEVSLTVSSVAVVLRDVTTDGQYWYAATDQGILRGTSSNPDAAWSALVADEVVWAAGRLCCAVRNGSSTTPNRFTTLGADGTEEQVGGHVTLDEGHTIVLGGAVGGSFWFGSYSGSVGQVWQWPLGVDENGSFHVPFVAWEMPPGLIPTSMGVAGGDVWVRAYRPTTQEVFIYRGVLGQGNLIPFIVAYLGVGEQPGGRFVEVGDMVLFPYRSTNQEAALGGVYLPTGGYARWLNTKVGSAEIADILEYQGKVHVVHSGGVSYELDDAWDYGWLVQSTMDGATLLDKVLDSIRIEIPPLQQDQVVAVAVSLDQGLSWTQVGAANVPGSQRQVFEVGARVNNFTIRVELTPSALGPARLFAHQSKYHGLGLRDVVVRVLVKAHDEMTGVNGAPLPENKPGRGAEIMRWLESLGQTRVLFQDIDWHFTRQADVWEVISVRSTRESLYDPHLGAKRLGGTVELTLRRPGEVVYAAAEDIPAA
ncbi:MAG TPA: hypothetical protein VF377_08850 [Acidimicrobiia bacterium]